MSESATKRRFLCDLKPDVSRALVALSASLNTVRSNLLPILPACTADVVLAYLCLDSVNEGELTALSKVCYCPTDAVATVFRSVTSRKHLIKVPAGTFFMPLCTFRLGSSHEARDMVGSRRLNERCGNTVLAFDLASNLPGNTINSSALCVRPRRYRGTEWYITDMISTVPHWWNADYLTSPLRSGMFNLLFGCSFTSLQETKEDDFLRPHMSIDIIGQKNNWVLGFDVGALSDTLRCVRFQASGQLSHLHSSGFSFYWSRAAVGTAYEALVRRYRAEGALCDYLSELVGFVNNEEGPQGVRLFRLRCEIRFAGGPAHSPHLIRPPRRSYR